MAKLDRLLNLVAALIDTTVPLTADDIRERVPGYSKESDDAFHRSFERDKDDLRELGIPIETVTVEHLEQPRAAYTILRDRYELDDPGLEPDELAALHLAATTIQVEGLDPDDVEEGLRKLGGVTAVDGATAAAGAPIGAVPMPQQLLDLFAATLERRVATFRYGDLERHVQPHRLQFERGRWYLSGHDVDRDAHRSFRLDRIDGPVSVGARDAFDRPEEIQGVILRPWELGEGQPVPTLVQIDRELARAVLTDDPGLVVARTLDDGAVVIELAVRNSGGLSSFMMTLLDRAEILSPEQYRTELVEWVGRFLPTTTPGATT